MLRQAEYKRSLKFSVFSIKKLFFRYSMVWDESEKNRGPRLCNEFRILPLIYGG